MLSDRVCSDLRRSNRVRSRPRSNAQPLHVRELNRGLLACRGLVIGEVSKFLGYLNANPS
jgi:hypothetical protein